MATIVDIRSAAAGKSARPQGLPAKGSAEILIFTGIRYTHLEEAPFEQSQAPERRLRDRIDLQD